MARPRGTSALTVHIGLTGPIGCGKSTVASWLGERAGVVVIDADQVARDVLEPGQPALVAVIARFGSGLVGPGGSLDRAALGRIVFADPAALRDLEAIKLVEGGLAALCDEVWLVTCDPAVQRERVVGRGTEPADAERRIAAQGDLTERLRPAATRAIDTSGTLADTRAIVADAYEATRVGAAG